MSSPYCNHTNVFGLSQYDNQCSFFHEGTPPLSEGLGWFIVVGLGFAFTICTSLVFWLVAKATGEHENAEHFATAGRSIKMGLTACDIVSKWTWAATLLQSSNVAYKFGVSGPFWYAAGATIQVLLFAILAIEVKRKAPTIHTVLEIIRARWGTTAHLVFLCFCFACNIIVTSMLILGGAAVINALSGVDLYAAAFLIPFCVTFYTAHGGLKATYMAAWAHVAIIYIALLIFVFLVYATYDQVLGSPSKVYHNLVTISGVWPVADNMGGSYVTMFSESGIIFGIINIIGNFGTVFVDQAYWQSAIAARPSATWKGYLLGGICWFAIPFTMATTLGLAGRAMDLPITIDESNQGLTPPAVAVQLMGSGGAFLLVLQLFMAVTSSASAEQIAVANLFTYDVYKTYFRKHASGRDLMLCSRIGIFVYGALSGVFAIVLFKIGLSLGWVYLFMGIIIGSAVFPIACALTWKKCSAVAAITSAVVTMPLAIMTWLVTAATLNDGVVDLNTTGQDYPMLAGNLVALFFSAILCTVLSFIWPQDFDWNEFKNIPTTGKDHNAEKDQWDGEDSPEMLDSTLSKVYLFGGCLSIVLIIIWPILALPAKIFSEGYFTFWVIISIIWGVVASVCCICLPLWEARDVFAQVLLCRWAPSQPALGAANGDPSSKAQSEYNLDAPKDVAVSPPMQQ